MAYTISNSGGVDVGPECTQSVSQCRQANCDPRYVTRSEPSAMRSRHIWSPGTIHKAISEAWRSTFKSSGHGDDAIRLAVSSNIGTGAQYSIIVQDALDHQVGGKNVLRISVCIKWSGIGDPELAIAFPLTAEPYRSLFGTSRFTSNLNMALDLKWNYFRGPNGVDHTMLPGFSQRALFSSAMKQFASLNPFSATMERETWRSLPDLVRSNNDLKSRTPRDQPWFCRATAALIELLVGALASSIIPPDIGVGATLEGNAYYKKWQ